MIRKKPDRIAGGIEPPGGEANGIGDEMLRLC